MLKFNIFHTNYQPSVLITFMGISAFSIAYLKIIRKIRLVTYISYVFSKNYKTTFNNYKQALCINKF